MNLAIFRLTLALLAYLIPNWQYLCWITSVPAFIYVILFWTMPESPRWLLTSGRIEEAEKVIRQAAKENGNPLPDTWKLEVKILLQNFIAFNICFPKF